MESMKNFNKGFTLPEMMTSVLLVISIVGMLLAIYTIGLRSFKIVQVNNMMKHGNSIAMGYITKAIKQATQIYTSSDTLPSSISATPSKNCLLVSEKRTTTSKSLTPNQVFYNFYLFELKHYAFLHSCTYADKKDCSYIDENKIKRSLYNGSDYNGIAITTIDTNEDGVIDAKDYAIETVEIDNILYSGTELSEAKVDNIVVELVSSKKVTKDIFTVSPDKKYVDVILVFAKSITRGMGGRKLSYIGQKSKVVSRNVQ